MKRVNNIYNRITDINTFIDVYDNEVNKNIKNKLKVEEFDNYYSLNIKEIKEELMSGDYIPGEYNIFFIREPKLRIIMSQSIKDKIINHLGNMTSQFVGILYLNELDYFIKEKLKIRYYIRYMDDGVLIHKNKEYLKYCLSEIERMIEKYKLSLNKKTRIYKMSEGIDFLGFRFIIKNNKIIMKIKNNTKKRFKRRLNINNMSSYIGHLRYGDCSNLIYKVLKEKELV